VAKRTTVFGLAFPYDQPTTGFVRRRGGDLRELISRGAVSPAALAAHCTGFQVNHRLDHLMPGTTLTFFNSRVGVYFRASVPDSPILRGLLAARESWRGISLAYDPASAKHAVDWPTCTRWVSRIEYISEISIIVGDRRPAYAATWVTTDRERALARMREELHVARWGALGPKYRAMPREILPRQSPRVEAMVRARDPNRALLDAYGEIPW